MCICKPGAVLLLANHPSSHVCLFGVQGLQNYDDFTRTATGGLFLFHTRLGLYTFCALFVPLLSAAADNVRRKRKKFDRVAPTACTRVFAMQIT